MADITQQEPAFLIAAVRHAVQRSSMRVVAAEAGMSHAALNNLLTGRTRRLNGPTVVKLRGWYLRQWTSGGNGLTPAAASYLIDQVLAAIALGMRKAAALELVDALESIYTRHGAPPPAWLGTVRDEYKGRWRMNQFCDVGTARAVFTRTFGTFTVRAFSQRQPRRTNTLAATLKEHPGREAGPHS